MNSTERLLSDIATLHQSIRQNRLTHAALTGGERKQLRGRIDVLTKELKALNETLAANPHHRKSSAELVEIELMARK